MKLSNFIAFHKDNVMPLGLVNLERCFVSSEDGFLLLKMIKTQFENDK